MPIALLARRIIPTPQSTAKYCVPVRSTKMSPRTPPRARHNGNLQSPSSLASTSSILISDNGASPPITPSARPSINPDHFTQGEIVTLFVGKKRKCFNIYKDLLCAKSPYFAASLKSCWNSNSNELYLEEDADAFGHFTNWLFRDTVPTVDLGSCEGLAEITAFYKLADFLLVEDLRNVIMDAILKYLKTNLWAFGFFSLFHLREQHLQTTPLYKLVLRSSVRSFIMGPERFEKGAAEDTEFLRHKPELMMDIIDGVREFNVKPYDQVWKCRQCDYHEHENSAICKG